MVWKDTAQRYALRDTGIQDQEEDEEWIHLHQCEWFWAMSLEDFNPCLQYMYRLQSDSLHLVTWFRLIVNDLINWCRILVWPPLAFFQPTSVIARVPHRVRRCLVIRNICLNHLNRWSFTSLTYFGPFQSTLRLTLTLLTKSFHHKRAMLRRYL